MVVQIEETEEAFLSAEKSGATSRRGTATQRRRRGMASRRGARSRHGLTTVPSESKIKILLNLSRRRELTECAFLSRSRDVVFQFSRIG